MLMPNLIDWNLLSVGLCLGLVQKDQLQIPRLPIICLFLPTGLVHVFYHDSPNPYIQTGLILHFVEITQLRETISCSQLV
jgi:hypothetical protein